jgi:hypothetical protein
MTPAVVQLLAELAQREPAYKKAYNRASGFMYSRVHARTLPRSEIDGPDRLQIKGLESKTNNDLKEDLHAHLHSFRRKVYDPDMHATILLGLMQEAADELRNKEE